LELAAIYMKYLFNATASSVGVYALMEGKVVNGRAVWQKQSEQERLLYYACNSKWAVSISEHMEAGEDV
jgi:hypothetical protein